MSRLDVVVATLLALVGLASGQHLFLAGGGLTAESEFFWNRLIQFAVSKKCFFFFFVPFRIN